MDRFTNKNDPQDQSVYAYCKATGDEIYIGESYLLLDNGEVLKDDLNAVLEYYGITRRWAGEEII